MGRSAGAGEAFPAEAAACRGPGAGKSVTLGAAEWLGRGAGGRGPRWPSPPASLCERRRVPDVGSFPRRKAPCTSVRTPPSGTAAGPSFQNALQESPCHDAQACVQTAPWTLVRLFRESASLVGLRGGQVLGRKPRGRAPAPTRRPPGRGRRVTCRRLATGSPRRRGTPCCSTTAASTRSTTSSPWRSWTSRCSSPSRQVGPLAGRAAPRQALGRLKAPRPHAAPSGVLTARPHVPVREPGLWADPGRAKVRVACGNPAGRLRGRGRGLAAARRTGGLGAHGPAVGEGRAPTRRGACGPRPLTSAFSPHLPPPTGETTTAVAPQVPGGVSDGRWHSVRVQYYNKVGGCGPRGPWAARGGRRALLRPEPFML